MGTARGADETRHAALAWRTLAWGLPRLEEPARERVLATLRTPPTDVAQAAFAAVVLAPARSLGDRRPDR